MTDPERLARLEWLRSEIAAAARRHTEILTARRGRLLAELRDAQPVGIPAKLAADLEPDPEQAEADLVLARRRQLVAMGRIKGDGSRADDLRAAHAAVKAGSVNPVLRALDREYQTWRKQVLRADQDSYVARRAGGRAAVLRPQTVS